jgi:hypothetical protein
MIGSDLRCLKECPRVGAPESSSSCTYYGTPSRLSDHCISKLWYILPAHIAFFGRPRRPAAGAGRAAASGAARRRRAGRQAREAAEQRSRRLRVGQLLCAVAATDSESLSTGPGPGPGPQSRSQSALSDGNSSWASLAPRQRTAQRLPGAGRWTARGWRVGGRASRRFGVTAILSRGH